MITVRPTFPVEAIILDDMQEFESPLEVRVLVFKR